MEIKTNYDSKNDIIYIYSKESPVDYSIDFDDIILDCSKNKITGIEIMDASKKLNTLSKNLKIKKTEMKINHTKNSIEINLNIEFEKQNTENLLLKLPLVRK